MLVERGGRKEGRERIGLGTLAYVLRPCTSGEFA